MAINGGKYTAANENHLTHEIANPSTLVSFFMQFAGRSEMNIVDVIREADSDHVIYFLLSAYVNTSKYDERLPTLPDNIVLLPLITKDQVRSRFETLMLELSSASQRLDNSECITIREALIVFGTALSRLQSLDAKRSVPRGFSPRRRGEKKLSNKLRQILN